MDPRHSPHDADKLATLTASLERDGWVGAPLVAWDTHLLTGSHRYAAAMALDWSPADVPTIDIRDIFAAAGLDFDALIAEEGISGADDDSLPWFVNHSLTTATRDAYGLDLH